MNSNYVFIFFLNQVGQLNSQYAEVNMQLRQKANLTDSSKLRAQYLLERAQLLSLNTTARLKELKGMFFTTDI